MGLLLGLLGIAFLGYALIYLNLEPQTILIAVAGCGTLVVLLLQPILTVHLFTALVYCENLAVTEGGLTGMQALGAVIVSAWGLKRSHTKASRPPLEPAAPLPCPVHGLVGDFDAQRIRHRDGIWSAWSRSCSSRSWSS